MPSAFKNPAPDRCNFPATCVMCSVCEYFSVLSKLPWLTSAENICHQPKQFQPQMLLRSWLSPVGGGRELAQYPGTLTNAKAKQNVHACSQELSNSPATKGTYSSSLPCTWGWVHPSSYHRPDAEEIYDGCPAKERTGDQGTCPNRKTKFKKVFLKVGISISTLH